MARKAVNLALKEKIPVIDAAWMLEYCPKKVGKIIQIWRKEGGRLEKTARGLKYAPTQFMKGLERRRVVRKYWGKIPISELAEKTGIAEYTLREIAKKFFRFFIF